MAEPGRPVAVCERHHEEAMDKFCSDCSQEICCKCMEDHQDHNVDNLQNVQSSLAKELHQLLQDLQERISVIKAYVESIKTELTEYNEATETVCTEVDEQVQQIYEAAKKLGDHFKSQVRRTKMKEQTKLVQLQEKSQSDIYQIQSSLVYTKELMKDKSVVNSNDAIKRLMTLKTETVCDSSDALPSLNTARFSPAHINTDLLYQLLGELSNDVDDGVLEHAFNLSLIASDSRMWCYSSEQQVENTRWRIAMKRGQPVMSSKRLDFMHSINTEFGLCYEGGADSTQILCKFTVEISTPRKRLLSFPDQNTFSRKQIYVVPERIKSPICTSETLTIRVRINRIDKFY
ncbi:hypothetical protein SNE40_012571 [Patella caerulea]|uniref:B box-type domain-containing protein n=1 Tax=Patella caerulea TaxID=87958 RepID=A0AAN8JRW7_PATCE